MIYLFKLPISKSLNWIVNKDRLNYSLCLKTLSLSEIGNNFGKSGNESLLREPEFPKNSRQVMLIMNKIIKLIHIDGFTLNLIHNISGNSIYVIWGGTRIFTFSWIIITRQGHQPQKDMQRSKMSLIEKQKNSGYPTNRKIHGYGTLVVGGRRSQSSFNYRRGVELRFLSEKPCISSNECARLVNLRKVNFENKFHVNKNTIHIISDMNVLILAYELIKSNPGNMTPGVDGSTLDGLDKTWLQNISTKIKQGKFLFSPGRKKYIPKPGSVDKRPLGIASPREKTVQKAILLVLESIFEPSFLRNSHGFRPNRGNHTALKMVKSEFHGVPWIIEGDISKCFDEIDHSILLRLLSKRISCDKSLTLIKRGLKAGFIDLGIFTRTKLGTPQGSILSPILCNIYLHELDLFLLQLKIKFDKGTSRVKNPQFRKLQYKLSNLKSPLEKKLVRRDLWKVHSLNPLDPNFCRIHFVRYADDFIVGVTSSHDVVLEVKNMIKEFLCNHLKLNLNALKTQITHIREKDVFFLGTLIKGNWKKEKPIRLVNFPSRKTSIKTRVTPRLSFHAPIKKLFDKATAEGFFRKDGINYKPTFVGKLINMDHGDILVFYNSIVRGVLNYYSFVDNHKSLGSWVHYMKFSCARTLALKYKLRFTSRIFKKFGPNLACPNTKKRLFLPTSFKRTQAFQINSPIPFEKKVLFWSKKITKSNLNKDCLICGSSLLVEMHHIRSVADIRKKLRSNKADFFSLQMAGINRKQVPLCREHHLKLHNKTLSPEETLLFQNNIKEI
uniref:Reverse transcriptase domain-containing protein n=1 Tax=Pyropia perforata TaxID=182771 RepID=A0A060DCK1_PYRPE|nr:hypothetical protein [Neoporphyra perforata]